MPLYDWRGSATIFDGFTGTRPVKELDNTSWLNIRQYICPKFPVHIIVKKKGKFFVPCLLKNAQLVGKTLKKAERNGYETVGKMRSKNHVTEASMLVFDLDGIARKKIHVDLIKIRDDGLTCLAYSTFSNGDPEKPGVRVRVVVPVDRPLNIEDYALAWHGFNKRYFDGNADSSAANLYQQQGTWVCRPSRQEQAKSWRSTAGIASADVLIAIGRNLDVK